MRHATFHLLVFTLLAALLFTTCKKEDDDTSGEEYVRVNINGVAFSSIAVSAGISTGGAAFEEALVIAANDGTAQSIGISFYGPANMTLSNKTYENGWLSAATGCDPDSGVCSILQTTQPFSATTLGENSIATINVTAVDYKAGGFIEGTFSGEAYTDSTLLVQFTDGKFRALIDE